MTPDCALLPTPFATGRKRVAMALQSIRHSLVHEVDVAGIARRLRISRRQLERDFRRWLGLGVMEYARRRRFALAAAALGQGAPIVHVALDYGYADQSHFTHTAKRLTGQTPGALRARARAGAGGTTTL